MKVSHLIAGGTAILTLTGTAVAATQVPMVFGHHPPAGWRPPALSATCQRRPVTIRYGKTLQSLKVAISKEETVVDLELKCTRKLALEGGTAGGKPPTDCWGAGVPAVSEAPADKQGYHDEIGLIALQAYLVSVRACEVGS